MHLTSLTLHGFKSFGDRTTLEFNPGITGVIGPNGSGKSNVIEALRWATGGGRASEFRAGDKTDLIFHGAAGKRSVSLAEVEVELGGSGPNGGKGRIRISRSLFRDGSSRLRLNGQNARFLDVEEALAGSGLGRGGVALIGQGEVSSVLMADPERLLGFVAEAAGVAKLQSRRETTATRLESAGEHVERLHDILHEGRRLLTGLEAEADQAARAVALDREVLRLRYSLSVRRGDALREEIAKLRGEEAELRGSLLKGREVLETAQTRWQNSRRQVADLEGVYREALAAAEARRGDLRVAQERLRGVRERYDALGREVTRLEADIAGLEALQPPTPPEGDEAALEREVADSNERALAASREAKEAEAHLSRLERDLAEAREREARYTQALSAYRDRRDGLQAQLGEVRERLSGLAGGGKGEEALAERLEGAQRALSEAEARGDAEREELAKLQEAHAHAAAEAQALARAADKSRAAFEARRGYAEGPRNALQSGLPGVIGSVADLISVPEAYSVAVASALGRRAENVVVDSAETAQRVLAHLKRAGGWATLLPLDLLGAKQPALAANLEHAPGVVGLLADLVGFEPRFERVVWQLLGGAVLVETIENAVALARSHPTRPRLVTLEGDVLEAYGAVTGGRRSVNTGLLGAAGEVAEAERAAEGAQGEAAEAFERLQAAQARFRAVRAEVERASGEVATLQTSLARHRERVAAAESLRAELTRREGELAAGLAGLQEPTREERDSLDPAALEPLVSDARAGLGRARERAEALGNRSNEARAALLLLRERAAAFREAVKRFGETQSRLRESRAHYHKVVAERREGESELAAALEAVERAGAALPQGVEGHERDYREAEAKSARLEAALTGLSEAQAERGAALETLSLTLARRETALEGAEEELRAFPAGLEPLEGSPRALRERLSEADREREAIGPVNHRAARDLETEGKRFAELEAQVAEAEAAVGELRRVLGDIDRETNARLGEALARLERDFAEHIRALFGPEAEAGIEVERDEGRPTGLRISLQPPGKQTRSLSLLSVGERTMGALGFLFALMHGGEAGGREPDSEAGLPIAILDEVDAPLDEANIRRFRDFLERLAAKGTQFVLITHQKATMEVANTLLGVTTEGGVSRVFSISRPAEAVGR